MELDFITKVLFRISPRLAVRRIAKKMGVDTSLHAVAHELFVRSQSVEIHPFTGGHRGFMMVLDRSTALYFYQDGEHFRYDGFELGEYEKGDVQVFDRLRG